jgi:aminoglycoside phosphotransferase (APT) family kinase protein
MKPFDIHGLPAEFAALVPPSARVEYPRQGMTADVAIVVHDGGAVVVKRCGHAIYLDWLRRERAVLEALAGSGLPIPVCLAYAETGAADARVGWLAMSYLPGRPLLGALVDASAPERVALLRRLGALFGKLHSTPVPRALWEVEDWVSRQLAQARLNLPWCDGTAAGLKDLERTRPAPVPERLIHGDMALDNVLVDARGALSLVDWAGGGPGDPRHDVALALQTKPEVELSIDVLDAFFSSYGRPSVDEATRAWFVGLYDYF